MKVVTPFSKKMRKADMFFNAGLVLIVFGILLAGLGLAGLRGILGIIAAVIGGVSLVLAFVFGHFCIKAEQEAYHGRR